jgi:hypothetical protein
MKMDNVDIIFNYDQSTYAIIIQYVQQGSRLLAASDLSLPS